MRIVLLLVAALLAPAAAALGPLPAQGTVEVYFTPWDDAEGALLRTIGQARHSIHVQAYTFSSRNLAWALGEAKKRGVAIEMLTDREQATKNEHSLVNALHDAGIPVWFEVRYASAHNKVMLVDAEEGDPVVVTGSYNFTFSAQARNAENLVILRGNAPLARAYLDNWRRHRRDAVPYSR
ncbi:MAG: phospholipase D family protein [Rhodocyclaceae bacterium]|nr:phospholipase D family protein [Rhodocyclaceae bacterium]